MIPWAGFTGDLLDFILLRIAGMRSDMRPDERNQAATAFLSLRMAVVRLEVAARDFLEQITSVKTRQKPRLFLAPVDRVAGLSDRASMQISQALRRLSIGVIDDDRLLRLLRGPYTYGGGMLKDRGIPSQFTELMTFETRVNQRSVFFLDCSSPAKKDFEVELQRAYESADDEERRVPPSSRRYTDVLESLVSELSVSNSIADNDVEKILALEPAVLADLETLSAARSRLDEFIRDKFSLEDFLYVPR